MELVIGIFSLALAITLVVGTEQGRELRDNFYYRLRRLRYLRSFKTKLTLNPSSSGPVFAGDRSTFIRDITLPAGSIVKPNTKVRQVWEIQNVGSVPWEDRYLAREGPHDDPKRLRSPARVRIPYAPPGTSVRVSVNLITPPDPGSFYAEWKMVDNNGRKLLPSQRPVYTAVDVRY